MNPLVILGLLCLGAACSTPAVSSARDAAPLERGPVGAYLAARRAESPSSERRGGLEALARAVAGDPGAELVFICTHNSRRSHMAQVWAQVAARSAGFDAVRTYSGGTEATAFHPNAIAALERAGFDVRGRGKGSNPVQLVDAGDGAPPMECFSKTFSDPANPRGGFVAVMTCADADEACPIVPGAARRIAVPYVDPKVSDGTPAEAATYDERCADIAREMVWAMDRAAELRDAG